MPANSDRNLLWGIIALQMDFIDRDSLVEGMQAWALEKSSSLGEILVKRGRLNSDERELLDALVEKHVVRHARDARKSLASLQREQPIWEISRQLGGLDDSDLEKSLSAIAVSRPPRGDEKGGPSQSSTGAFDAPTFVGPQVGSLQRFQVLSLHASGGLGNVYQARDLELNRIVALKEMQPEVAHDASGRNRFLLEAEVTGSLEHPGIVPVYSFGRSADQRPFYAMRFIRGQSFSEAIRGFHSKPADRSERERVLEFRKLLKHFTDICYAVAYAHSRGVLHRDLKPSNVMLGPYGETLVVDWGLAKVVGRDEQSQPANEETLRPIAAGGSSETAAGSAVGTLAYMSPEQAAGELDHLGPASDIFSLGATLYVLLTGRTHIEGNDPAKMMERVRSGFVTPPREVRPAVPPPLESICLRAMATDPSQRYDTARRLAEDIEAWLGDEPVSAHRDSVAVKMGRWARRRKPLVAGLAGLVGTALVALAVSTILISREQARTQHQRETAERQGRVLSNFAQVRHLESGIMRHVTRSGQLPILKESEATLQKIMEIQSGLVAEFPAESRYQEQLATTLHGLAALKYRVDKLDEAESLLEQAISIQEALLTEPADDVALSERLEALIDSLSDLGDVTETLGRHEDAEDIYRRALRVASTAPQDSLSPTLKRTIAAVNINLGNVLTNATDRSSEAKEAYLEGISHFEELVTADPDNAEHRQDLAVAYSNLAGYLLYQGELAEAEEKFEKALVRYEALVRESPEIPDHQSGLAMVLHNIASLLAARGDFATARSRLESAIESQRLAWDANPTNPFYRQSLSDHYWLLSDTLIRLREPQQAAAAAEAMLPIFPQRWEEPFYAAGLIARCSAILLAESSGDDEQQALADSYADRSLQLLNDAVTKGYEDLDGLNNGPEFNSLRERPDFQELLNRISDK